ncbi:MAG: hypothetical protein ACRC1M_05140, partial [Methanobacteriaceae archaeon]
INTISYNEIKDMSNEIIISKKPSRNSVDEIKERISKKLASESDKYSSSSDIKIVGEVFSVKTGENPFIIEITTKISGEDNGNPSNTSNVKGKYESIEKNYISIEGLNDPMPILKCDIPVENLDIGRNKINYKNTLKDYIIANGIEEGVYYENASSSLTIRKCPHIDYIEHGEGVSFKNCMDNGNYHESLDGSCYLCRLEGKGSCYHYGIETFIIPSPETKNIGNPGIGNIDIVNYSTGLKSVSASDHIIFGENSYLGEIMTYYEDSDWKNVIFLDESHRSKYGLTRFSY